MTKWEWLFSKQSGKTAETVQLQMYLMDQDSQKHLVYMREKQRVKNEMEHVANTRKEYFELHNGTDHCE